MRWLRTLLAVVVAVSLGHEALAQELYKWTDPEGHVHYTDKRPPDAPAATPAPPDDKDRALLDRTEQALASGDTAAAVALFRYFEDVVGAREAANDRQIIGAFIGFVKDGFGRPQGFEPTNDPALGYLSARIGSAATPQWNASECLFKTYAIKTTFASADARHPAEVHLTVCTGPRVAQPALRQIEFRFTQPNAVVTQKIQTVMTKTMAEGRRLSGPKS